MTKEHRFRRKSASGRRKDAEPEWWCHLRDSRSAHPADNIVAIGDHLRAEDDALRPRRIDCVLQVFGIGGEKVVGIYAHVGHTKPLSGQ